MFLNKIKLAIVTSHPIQYQAPLFRAIANTTDIDVTVYFGSDHGTVPGKIDPGFGKAFAWDIPLLDGYKHVFLKNSRPNIEINNWRLDGPELRNYFLQEQFDAVMVFGWNRKLFWQAIWWARANNIPLIMRGESNTKKKQSLIVKVAKRLLFPFLFSQFRSFIAIGKLNRELYLNYGVSDRAIINAPYCVDNEYFANSAAFQKENALQLRKNLKISTNDTVFLFVAKLINRKRPLDLILAHAATTCKGIHTIIVGDGPLMQECESIIETRSIKNIHMAGFKNQSELPVYYEASDALILPSEYETWGLVVNEAMACGLPCVTSDGCGASEDMIIEGKTGFTFHVGDFMQMSSIMDLMAQDPALLSQMKSSTVLHINKYRFEHTVKALKEALNVRC